MPFSYVCEQCGEAFVEPRRKTQRRAFCSRACYWKSMETQTPDRECLGCGEPLVFRGPDIAKAYLDRQFCEWSCYLASQQGALDRWLAIVVGTRDCWAWPHSTNADGYGVVVDGGRQVMVHRAVYERTVGPIPAAQTLDHTCHNEDNTCTAGQKCQHRRCANPAHLVPRTGRENTLLGRGPAANNARKTHCLHGHCLSGDNLYSRPDGARACRKCQAERERRYRERKRKA